MNRETAEQNTTVDAAAEHAPGASPAADGSMREQVARVLELMRPAIQSDGGDVELVAVSPEGEVIVRLHGACVGCPSSLVTLKAGIERNLKSHVRGIQSVEAVN